MKPTTDQEVQEAVRELSTLTPVAGGSKPALSTPTDGIAQLDVSGLCGVLDYIPEEFTFTALAGTQVTEINALLAANDQYLPFDPPLAHRGATLGGTLAAGLSGPGRYRYGGVRDFILGVQFVTGAGELVRAGGKVVKNAAGFDFPKLLVGSLGRLGVLTEVSFKVFPNPDAYITLRVDCQDLESALNSLMQLTTVSLDIAALDLEPPTTLWIRLAGFSDVILSRLERVYPYTGNGEIVQGEQELTLWRRVRDFEWVVESWNLVKVPITPGRISALESELQKTNASRRYSVGGNVAWIAWPPDEDELDGLLHGLGLEGLRIFGEAGCPFLGMRPPTMFATRVKHALDPHNRFPKIA